MGTPPRSDFLGLEIADDGTLYTTRGDDLYKGPLGGSVTQVGTGMSVGSFMDFAMDSHGVLYAVGSAPGTSGASSIYTIYTATAAGTLVGTLANHPCLMGIAFDRSDNLFATEFCSGPYSLWEISNLSASNPSGAIAT